MIRVKRQELKYLIPYHEYIALTRRLDKVLVKDRNCTEGPYKISSLYYDDIFNSAYHQKVDGYSNRSKFRIRYYDDDLSYFKLEKKMKNESITNKDSVFINKEDVDNILSYKLDSLKERNEPLLNEFIRKLQQKHFCPKVLVEYDRLAYTHPVGNVRITFDQFVKGSYTNPTISEEKSVCYDAIESNMIVMEIKFNEILPLFIKSIIQTSNVSQQSISKYVLSRDLLFN